MQFVLTEENVRSMMQRLRSSVGHDKLGVSKAYEAVAHTLGYPNWDTLSGLIRKPMESLVAQEVRKTYVIPEIRISQPVTMYLGTRQTEEYEYGPSWAKLVFTQQLVDSLLSYRQQLLEGRLSEIEVDLGEALYPGRSLCGAGEVVWNDQDRYNLELWHVRLVVEKRRWWISVNHRHSANCTESYSFDFEQFLSCIVLDQDTTTDSWARKNGVVFHTSGVYGQDYLAQFLESLVEQEELDDSYLLAVAE